MTKSQKIILATILAVAVFLIIFRFTETPMVWTDEGVFTETARSLAVHGVLGLQTAPEQFFSMRNFLLSTGYPVIFPVALSFKLFGIGLWQARMPMLIYMFLLILAFYLFAKKRYGFWPAVFSVLLLISFSPFYGNGRPIQGEVPGLFFLVLGLWLLESDYPFLSGLALGLSASVKPIFLAGIIGALLLTFIIKHKKIGKKILYILLGLIPPLLVWFVITVPTYHDALNFIPNFIYYSGNHGSSLPLFQTVKTNSLRFVKESTPILFLFLALIISLSIIFKLRIGEKLSFTELTGLIFIILNWGGYIIGTGWYRYFFPAHILLYLFFPAAVLFLGYYFNNKKLALGLLSALIIFQFSYLVFFSDTSFINRQTRNAELTKTLSGMPLDKSILFYGDMEAIVFFKGENYSQYYNLGGFLDTGNSQIINHPTADYILIDHDTNIQCYAKVPVSRYYFFTRMCKKS